MTTGLALEHPDFPERYRATVDPDADDEHIEAERQTMLRQFLSGAIDVHVENGDLETMLTGGDALATVIYGLEWVIVQAEPDAGEFVTSDRALAVVDSRPKFPWAGEAPASSPGAATTIPLDPNHLLLLRHGPPRVTTANAQRREVEDLNLRTYGWAERFVFGRTQKTVQDLRSLAKRWRTAVPRPRCGRIVLCDDADPNDPNVGSEHLRRGWPRGLWHQAADGTEHFHAYRLLEPGDRVGNHLALVANLAGPEEEIRAHRVRLEQLLAEPAGY
jgi:hypothetical protein